MTDRENDKTESSPSDQGNVLPGRTPSEAESALLDYGKQTVLQSTRTSLDFHRTMLKISATFGGLIGALSPILVWGDTETKVPEVANWLLVLPQVLILLSAVAFAFGYYPRHDRISINVVENIRSARKKVLRQRKCLAVIGMSLFCAALLLVVVLIVLSRSKAL